MRTVPNGPAAQAGLRPTRRDVVGRIRLGDFIVGVNGEAIETRNDFYDRLQQRKVGETLTLTIERDGQRLDVNVTLGSEE